MCISCSTFQQQAVKFNVYGDLEDSKSETVIHLKQSLIQSNTNHAHLLVKAFILDNLTLTEDITCNKKRRDMGQYCFPEHQGILK